MGGRSISMFVAAGAIVLAACGERPDSTPTSPDFAGGSTGGCSFTTVSSLTKNEFGANSTQSGLATDMKNAGAKTNNATYIGYEILTAIEGKYAGASAPAPTNAAQLTVALLQCMSIAGTTIPTADTFAVALASAGAYGVRGLGGVANPDTRALLSHDGSWLIEPPAGSNWQAITTTGVSLSDSVNDALLVYGYPADTTGFTKDDLQSAVFHWSSIPTASFSPGVIVGECNSYSYLQHNPSGPNAEVLGFVDPGCPTSSAMLEPAPRSLADRIVRFFQPAPLAAATLITGTGGSKTSLSPFGVVFPGNTVLVPGFKWNKSGYYVNQPFTPTINYQMTSAKGTNFKQQYVLVWLEATNNQGSKVALCNNYAYTNTSGVVNFPVAYLNKAGGYTITTKSAGAFSLTIGSLQVVIPAVPPSAPLNSPLVNVKNSTTTRSDCAVFAEYTVDANGAITVTQAPPFPGPNGQ